MNYFRELATQKPIKVYVDGKVKLLRYGRPKRKLPNGAYGIAYKRKVYELINNEYIDINSEGFSIESCPHSDFKSMYEGFNASPVTDFALSINQCKPGEKFDEVKNSLYIDKKGTMFFKRPLVGQLVKTWQENHHLFYQIIIDTTRIDIGYLRLYLSSELAYYNCRDLGGRHSMKLKIFLKDLNDLIIYHPNLKEQKLIADTVNEVSSLSKMLDSKSKEIPFNSDYAKKIRSEILRFKKAFGALTETEEVKQLILNGESKRIEFKSTWSYCLNKKDIMPHLEDKCLSNIVGFMNAVGGDLLIGVEDDGNILGIDTDLLKFKKNPKKNSNPLDSFLNFIKDKLKTRVGRDDMQFINWRYVEIDGKKILRIICEPAPKPVLLDGEHLAVRFSPAVEILTGKEMLDYIEKRFH
jgi:hypothetical protein